MDTHSDNLEIVKLCASGFRVYPSWLTVSVLISHWWLGPTRLETRTEESGVCASRTDQNHDCRMKVNRKIYVFRPCINAKNE